MNNCPKCNNEIKEGDSFCDSCGTQIFERVFCHNCGEQTSTEFEFCENCGSSTSAIDTAEDVISVPVKKESSKKPIIFGGIGVLVIALIVLMFSSISGGKSSKNYALYLKDFEIYHADINKIEPSQLTTNLLNGEDVEGVEYYEIINFSSEISNYITYSKDGNMIFFLDRLNNSGGQPLYYQYLNKKDSEVERVDTDIFRYTINDSGNKITYIKGYDGILYQSDLTDKERIDKDVNNFYVSDDGNKIIYSNSEGTIYVKDKGKDKERIDGDSSIAHVSEDLSTVYYTKDDSLYMKQENSDKVKVASDIFEIINIYDTGEIYYLKSNSMDASLMDYVQDDMKEVDESMAHPIAPERPYWYSYDTDEEYETAYEQYSIDYDKYREDENAYYNKVDRDSIREDLRNTSLYRSKYSLYYYNGKEEVEVTDSLVYDYYYDSNMSIADDIPVMSFRNYSQTSINKPKISEIYNVWEVEDMINEALFGSTELYVAIGDKMHLIEETSALNLLMDAAGKNLYYLDDYSYDRGSGDLYRVSITKDGVQKPELYDMDVSIENIQLISQDKILYYKDINNSIGDLYINKENIDFDVRLYYHSYDDGTDKLVYFTDWNEDRYYGTLKVYTNGEKLKIEDDVFDYVTAPNGDILYLYDYSMNYLSGELYLYGPKENKKIDDDVMGIIPINNSKIRGVEYGW